MCIRDSFWGLRTERWTYVTYPATDETELYDNEADPDQLRNLAADPEQAALVADLSARLAAMHAG